MTPIYQSAYRKGHSIDTALMEEHSDIVETLDRGWRIASILLDLSAAFDAINHQILVNRLQLFLGNKEKALSW